jgi:hypothetical protein
MKMVGHQAPGQNINLRKNKHFNFRNEKQIILPIKKYFLFIVALIIDMINIPFFE